MIKTDHQIAYKPLGMSSTSMHDDDDDDDVNESDDEDDGDATTATRKQYSDCEETTKLPLHEINMFNINPNDRGCCGRNFLGLRQLRSTLYLVAAILFLIFVARLTTDNNSTLHDSSESKRTPPSASYLKSSGPIAAGQPQQPQQKQPSISQTTSIIANDLPTSTPNQEEGSSAGLADQINDRPKYDNYLMSVLRDKDPRTFNSNQSLDDLQISEQQESQLSADKRRDNIWWTLGSRVDDKYITVTNYIRAMKSFNSNSSITLTTQATTEFMYHILELCKRWDGPISVAVYSPGSELSVALTVIKYMRQCLPVPLGTCVRDKVSWHLVYNKLHSPTGTLRYPRYHVDSQHYPLFANHNECPKLPGPDAADLIKQFEVNLKQANGYSTKANITTSTGSSSTNYSSYRQQFRLTYPINVLRNVARLAATTHYILASDVELYPSVNLVPRFISLIRNKFASDHQSRTKISQEYGIELGDADERFRFVFTLPIFEVKSNISAPRTKEELVRLFKAGDAIFFHKWVCDACQNFPNRLKWLEQDKFISGGLQGRQTANDNDDELVVFEATQRDKSRDSWEPIFIGTNEDPLYDDRLTWEGRRDKMGQMYEMCLQDYHLFVLGDAFLVHAPGIKHFDKQDFAKRYDFIKENNMIYDETNKRLRQQFANSKNINKC